MAGRLSYGKCFPSRRAHDRADLAFRDDEATAVRVVDVEVILVIARREHDMIIDETGEFFVRSGVPIEVTVWLFEVDARPDDDRVAE